MNLNAAVSYDVVPGFPQGTVLDHIVVSLAATNPANNQSKSAAANAPSVSFANVPADTYTVSVQGAQASGAVLGTPVSQNITITQPVVTISLNLPSALTLSQS